MNSVHGDEFFNKESFFSIRGTKETNILKEGWIMELIVWAEET